MRIGIDARLIDYRVGGIARYATQLIRALDREASSHDLVAVRSRHPKLAAPDLPVARLGVHTPPHHRLERWTLAWELRGANFDLLHSPDFIPPRRGRWRSVVTVHDLAFLHMPGLLTGASRRYYGQIYRAVDEANAVIAVSRSTADDLMNLAGADPQKITVVHEAADPEFAPQPRSTAQAVVRDRLGIDASSFVLFVGTIEPRKNLPALIQAFAQLRKDFPVELVIAGPNGWLSSEVFTQVRDESAVDGVRFVGEVSAELLPTLYSAADVLALPSLYEGFGLPALEAMACGTPVVASHAGALPEVVGDAGVLIRPDDPADIAAGLGWVLGNPEFRNTLRARGLERAAAFSWQRAARETLEVYERVMAG